jgi:signal transduction histidine kinase
VKDFSIEWPTSNLWFLGTVPIEEAPLILTDRTADVLVDLILSKNDNLSENLDPIIDQLGNYASSFQAQSISIILEELVSNAFYYSGINTTNIKIICQRSQDKGIAITVIDGGGKLPEAQIKALFKERTIPVNPRYDSSQRGAGLGLYFCREFSSGIFIKVVEGSSTSVTCFVPYRMSKNSTIVMAMVIRHELLPTF